jgi:hypothetical protein
MAMFVPSTSPMALRARALEHNGYQFAGDLEVTNDGKFVIKGRYVTLNEAIMACGRYDLQQYRKVA